MKTRLFSPTPGIGRLSRSAWILRRSGGSVAWNRRTSYRTGDPEAGVSRSSPKRVGTLQGAPASCASWSDGSRRPLPTPLPQVITGDAGVGKSAVLARLVTMADPEY